ncbi:MAG: cytidylate kinase [Clostridia bacterium]|jgi:cytidylate kinase|nr:cytidylate kinase [Clostridia bacterium]
MDKNYVITIGRQYGSGGRETGKLLAKRLNIDFYDKELITLVAKKNGMSEKIFENVDEKPTNSLLYSLAMGAYAMDGHYVYWGDVAPSINDKVYQMQTDLIREFAFKKSCIFVGRCADYILSDHPCCINIFLTSKIENRIKNVIKRNEAPANKVEDLIIKTDKRRANYYSFHTNRNWGEASNYDLCIDIGSIGIENTVNLIEKYVEMKTSIV